MNKGKIIFKSLSTHKFIMEEELKYLSYDLKTKTNLGKLYIFPKIHTRLYNVPGPPVILNRGTPV